ncbi:dioxygenase family protein [Acinetobacter sp. WZC-1]|uniref:dioxygenase family protein n=1 Tax=Acinetobacter sp. WZC-1 TaxID=3459034 RepID=UPI00403DA51E
MNKVTQSAIDSFGKIESERNKFLIQQLTRTLHQFVNEVQLTQQEWEKTIDFLTRTGQKCDEHRQEYILLSDVMGLSMLVDEINHSKSAEQTPSTVFGPFFIPNMPLREYKDSIIEEETSQPPLIIRGNILNQQQQPVAGAKIEVWQTADNGMYSGQDPAQSISNMRGAFISQPDGAYALKSILPISYQIPSDGTVGELLNYAKRHFWRPAHIHFMITAPGYQTLVTHLFVSGDDHLREDTVFGVKDQLIVDYQTLIADQQWSDFVEAGQQFHLIEYQFVLPEAS